MVGIAAVGQERKFSVWESRGPRYSDQRLAGRGTYNTRKLSWGLDHVSVLGDDVIGTVPNTR